MRPRGRRLDHFDDAVGWKAKPSPGESVGTPSSWVERRGTFNPLVRVGDRGGSTVSKSAVFLSTPVTASSRDATRVVEQIVQQSACGMGATSKHQERWVVVSVAHRVRVATAHRTMR